MSNLGVINRMTLREQVLDTLRAGILSGQLPPGSKLGEFELAERLGVSRGTVREALRHLHQSGLAEGAERNSLHVRILSPQDILDLYELRAALEIQAALKIVARPDSAQVIDELEALLVDNGQHSSHAEQFRRDLAFHQALCEACGNQMLLKSWHSLEDLLWITVMSGTDEVSQQLLKAVHHQPIIDALRTKDATTIRNVIAGHMQQAADHWSELASQGKLARV